MSRDEREGFDVDVVVVGGGPVGLSAAVALGRLGVRTVLVERRETTSQHPKAHWENARTMEIFRQWGVEDEIRRDALPDSWLNGALFVTRLAGHELGAIRWDEDPEYLARSASLGPAPSNSVPQDVVEPVLRAAAGRLGCVDLRFGAEAVDVEQDADGVMVAVRDGGVVRARYAIVADGARSALRDRLGVALDGPGAIGSQLGVYFHADLTPYVDGRHALLYWIYSPQVQGVLICLDGRGRWHFLFPYDAEVEGPEDYPAERCAAMIAEAVVGDPDCPVDVRSVLPWRMSSALAERFRVGRVFLAGDAAHSMPPTGGLGLNTGVADVHNLAWKLAAVLRGDASSALLDSYEAERRPVAAFNSAYSLTNATKMAESGLSGILVRDPDAAATLEQPEGEALREVLRAAIPDQREQFYFEGVTLGYAYEAGAVVADGSAPEPSTIAEYRPSGRPGGRAPHAWVRREGERISTVDLADGRFVLLAAADGDAWVRAATAAGRGAGLELDAYRVVPAPSDGAPGVLVDEQGGWAQACGLGPSGAILVRPDGHVGWRAADGPAGDAEVGLGEALDVMLGRAVPVVD